jgi:hypothetical protein
MGQTLIVAEEVGIVGGSEVGRQFTDLGLDGLANSFFEVIDLGSLLGRDGRGRHGWAPLGGQVSRHYRRSARCVQRFYQLS